MTPFAASLTIGMVIGFLGTLATWALARRARDDDAIDQVNALRIEITELRRKFTEAEADRSGMAVHLGSAIAAQLRHERAIDAAQVRLSLLETQVCGRPHVLATKVIPRG